MTFDPDVKWHHLIISDADERSFWKEVPDACDIRDIAGMQLGTPATPALLAALERWFESRATTSRVDMTAVRDPNLEKVEAYLPPRMTAGGVEP
jgi:hypothetical protein